MPKTNYINSMVSSGCMEKDYIRFISKEQNNPIALNDLLSEIDAKINSQRREWLLEVFDSARDFSKTKTEDLYNLGIVLAKCQGKNFYTWSRIINNLELKLQEARLAEQQFPQESNTIKFFGVKIYEKLSPSQKIEKKLKEAVLQRGIANRYLDCLFNILECDSTPSSYKSKKMSAADFILNLLSAKNNVSMLHIAVIHKDDVLTVRLFSLLNQLISKGADILSIYNLLTTRGNFFRDNSYKKFDGFTIGHCLAASIVALPNAIYEYLLLLENMIRKGVTASQIRKLLEMPIADIPEENFNTFLIKYFHLLSEPAKIIYGNLHQYLFADYQARRDTVTRPLLISAPEFSISPVHITESTVLRRSVRPPIVTMPPPGQPPVVPAIIPPVALVSSIQPWPAHGAPSIAPVAEVTARPFNHDIPSEELSFDVTPETMRFV